MCDCTMRALACQFMGKGRPCELGAGERFHTYLQRTVDGYAFNSNRISTLLAFSRDE